MGNRFFTQSAMPVAPKNRRGECGFSPKKRHAHCALAPERVFHQSRHNRALAPAPGRKIVLRRNDKRNDSCSEQWQRIFRSGCRKKVAIRRFRTTKGNHGEPDKREKPQLRKHTYTKTLVNTGPSMQSGKWHLTLAQCAPLGPNISKKSSHARRKQK